tara:strand:- start:3696 stop:5006 length:1311 start_codon:yes stop_codon:yes gene_type:complete
MDQEISEYILTNNAKDRIEIIPKSDFEENAVNPVVIFTTKEGLRIMASTVEELVPIFESQRTFNEEIAAAAASISAGFQSEILGVQKPVVDAVLNEISSLKLAIHTNDNGTLQGALRRLGDWLTKHRNSNFISVFATIGAEINNLLQTHPISGAIKAGEFLGVPLPILQRHQNVDLDLLSVIRAYIELLRSEIGGTAQIQASATAFHTEASQWRGEMDRLNSMHLKSIESLKEMIAEAGDKITSRSRLADKANIKWAEDKDALLKAYDEQLKLEAPATYWNDKRKRHRNVGIAAAIVFIVAVSFGVLWLINSAPLMIRELMGGAVDVQTGKPLEALPPLTTLALITLPALGYAWVLRLVARVFLSNLDLASDSEARSTMITTYLALIKDSEAQMRSEDRTIILSALFRPIDPNSNTDAPPPNLIDIIKNSQTSTKP